MNGIDELREKFIKAKKEYETKYVVSIEKNEKIDIELMCAFLKSLEEHIVDTVVSLDKTKLLIVCRSHEKARVITRIVNENYGYCARII